MSPYRFWTKTMWKKSENLPTAQKMNSIANNQDNYKILSSKMKLRMRYIIFQKSAYGFAIYALDINTIFVIFSFPYAINLILTELEGSLFWMLGNCWAYFVVIAFVAISRKDISDTLSLYVIIGISNRPVVETRFLPASQAFEKRRANGAIAALQGAIKNATGNWPIQSIFMLIAHTQSHFKDTSEHRPLS